MSALWGILRAPLAVIVLHSVVSGVLGHDRGLDPWFHFLGGAAGAVGLWEAWPILPARILQVLRRRWLFVAAAMTTVTLLWEVMEFLSDRFLATHVQLGFGDTTSDVALGNLGLMVAVVALAWWTRRRRATLAAG